MSFLECVHLTPQVEGWWDSIRVCFGLLMGARARGKTGAQSPLALRPVPVPPHRYFRDFSCFLAGFSVALGVVIYLLLD